MSQARELSMQANSPNLTWIVLVAEEKKTTQQG